MNERNSFFRHTDYRQLLREALKFRGYSYRSFVAKHPTIIKFSMLGASLSGGRAGQRKSGLRNLSLETTVKLGKALRLDQDQLAFLVLLKIENDAVILPGLYGGAFSDLARSLLEERRDRASKRPELNTENQIIYSEISLAAAKVLDGVPDASRKKICAELLAPAKAILSRQRRKPGVRTLALNIERLEELTR